MVKATLKTPYTTMERILPTKELAEKWGYKTICLTVPDCNKWISCELIIDGRKYPTTLQEVSKFRG